MMMIEVTCVSINYSIDENICCCLYGNIILLSCNHLEDFALLTAGNVFIPNCIIQISIILLCEFSNMSILSFYLC